MTLDLDKILKDAAEFEKVRAYLSDKKWEMVSFDRGDGDSGACATEDGNRLDMYNFNVCKLTVAAKNYDSTSIIRQLVDRIKELNGRLYGFKLYRF